MKVLLVCAGGLSTSILMKKMTKYAAEKGFELEVKAVGVGEYAEEYKNYEVILVGPQVSYKKDEIAEKTQLPTMVINQMDYALGNVENIFKAVDKILPQQ